MNVHVTLIVVFSLVSQIDLFAQCQLNVTGMTPPSCPGSANGKLTVFISNGVGPYQYTWTGPVSGTAGSAASVYLIDQLPAGNYSISVSDNAGCTAETLGTVAAPVPLYPNLVITNLRCYNDSSGAIDLTVSGGSPPYIYSWSNGANTEDISNISIGTYRVTVTDQAGCTSISNAAITQPFKLFVPRVVTPASCAQSNGSINTSPNGGVPPYFFVWSHGAITEDAVNLSIGTYTVTVTDSHGCTETNTAFVPQTPDFTLSFGSTPTNCADSVGTIDLTVTGGTGPFTYLWSAGQTTEDADSLIGGFHTVTVTSAVGCTASGYTFVASADGPQITLTPHNADCQGGNTGSIEMTVVGGTPGYEIYWSTGETGLNLGNVGAGTYSVTVVDITGCSNTAFAVVGQGVPMVLTISVIDVGCAGQQNGGINLTVTGGVPPYSYYWTTTTFEEDLFNVWAGTYCVTVTDSEGCTADTCVDVGSPAPLTVAAAVSNVSCAGSNDGAVDITVSGGTGLYTFLWTTFQATEDINQLGPGTYCVTVTDENGCTTSTCGTVTAPAPIALSAVAIPASCTGSANGAIDLGVSGGTLPLETLWSNNNTSQDLTGLTAGVYTVTATDAHVCTSTLTVTVPAGDSPISVAGNATPVNTCGANDGGLNLDLSDAMAPFSYSWSNGTDTGAGNGIAAEPFSIDNLPAGVYHVTITDGTGCTAVTEQWIGSPMSLTAAATPISACQADDGAISITVSGAAPDFSYTWERGQTAGSGNKISVSPFQLSNLEAGEYRITVINASGCFSVVSTTVEQSALIALSSTKQDVTCSGGTNGAIDLTVNGGNGPYNFFWSSNATTEDLANAPAGSYTVTVSDNNGCTASASVNLTEPDLLVIQLLATPVSCYGAATGSIDASIAGGTPVYTFTWSNSETTEDLVNLSAGMYTVTVSDINGCTQISGVTVTEAAPGFTLSLSVAPPSGCLQQDGVISVDIINGTPDFEFAWTNGTDTGSDSGISNPVFNISGLNPGNYTVTVTNGDGCSLSQTATVEEPPFSVSVFVNQARCDGMIDGSLQVTIVDGKVPGYAYQWNSAAGSGDGSGIAVSPFTIPDLPIGNYSITITNGAGCSVERNFTVASDTMKAFFGPVNASCGQPFGYINVSVTGSGNVPPFSWAWSSGSSTDNGTAASQPFNITGLTPGAYQITLTNGLGCTLARTVIITPGLPVLTIFSSSDIVTCYGGSDGVLTVNISSSSTAPYSYQWSNGITSGNGASATEPFMITGLQAGNYNITVSDGGGCTGSISQTVNQPIAPTFSVNVIPVRCYGDNNGAIDITYTGANPPFGYSWSGPNGASYQQADLTNLIGGLYALTVTNATGCTFSPPAVMVNNPVNPLLATIANGNCGSDVAFVVNTGGVGPYSVLWNNNATTDTINGLLPGQYAVTVTDANGCTAGDTAFVQTNINLCGLITGGVYEDVVGDCVFDNEPPLSSWLVKATGIQTYYALTGPDGQFQMNVAPGDYMVEVVAPDPVWMPCPNTTTVSVTQPNIPADAGAFLVGREVLCPALYVDISTTFLRRCSSANVYQIQYCNNGSAPALNVYLDVLLDPLMIPQSASVPYTNLGNHTIRFQLGAVAPGACGQISLRVFVSCSAVLGQTHCTEAHIYPDTLCLPSNANWSGASLALHGDCDANSVRFVVKNKGAGIMDHALDYIVIEDHVMLMQGEVNPLLPGDSLEILFPANGSTWRMEVQQEDFHPGHSMPSATVEGCTTNGNFSTGYVTQFPLNNLDPWIDIDCQQNIGSWDPNDKRGFPEGYGSDHYVRPGTPIEYVVRFQNTGTDTAFNIYVLDTLSPWLNPATFRPGASSHAYTYDIFGTGILRFDFEGIMLPDSNVNEPASHGFIAFTLMPHDSTPLETVLYNSAAIYFDFNDPVITNTTRHTLGLNFIASGYWNPVRPENRLNVRPNPMQERAFLELEGVDNPGELRWELTDQTGRIIRVETTRGAVLEIQRTDLPTGIYFIRVEQKGNLFGQGKIIVR